MLCIEKEVLSLPRFYYVKVYSQFKLAYYIHNEIKGFLFCHSFDNGF